MFWKSTDESRLIAADESDQKEIAALQKKCDKTQPAFDELLGQCLTSQVMLGALDHLEIPHSKFESEFISNLQERQRTDIAKLNALTANLEAEIESLKQRSYQRRSHIASECSIWLYAVMGGLAPGSPLYAELEAAYNRINASVDSGEPSSIISTMKPLLDKIENDPDVKCPLFRFSALVSKVVGEPVPSLAE